MIRAAVAVVLAAVLAACTSTSPTPVYTTATAAGDAKITIGIYFTEPGLGLKSGDKYSGFDVDTARYVANKLGFAEKNIVWKEVTAAQRQSVLEDGTVDLVVATYSITDERKKVVDFAGPYFVAHQGLLIRRNDDTITGYETLDGKKLCSGQGTTSAQRVKDRYKGKITLVTYPKDADCAKALYDGKVDAFTTDDLILAGFAAQGKYKGVLKVLDKTFSDEPYGVGIKKGDTAMVKKVTAALKSYISDGSWKKSLDRNVASSGYSIPSPPTVDNAATG